MFGTTQQIAPQQSQFAVDWKSIADLLNRNQYITNGFASTLSSQPQYLQPQSAGPGQLQPQFDFGSLIGPIVSQVVPAILSALSASPQGIKGSGAPATMH